MRWRGVVQRFYWHLLETVGITPLTSPFYETVWLSQAHADNAVTIP